MSAHTKGTWEVSPSGQAILARDGDNVTHVAKITPILRGGSMAHEEEAANLRLLIAAPKLLAVCEALVAAHNEDGIDEATIQARAVIATVRGLQ